MAKIRMSVGRRVMALGAMTCVLVGGAALPAVAADEPTESELMADCASGVGKCTFNNPTIDRAYLGDYHQVSNTLYNCSTSPASQGMDWSDSVGSSDSLEVSITAGGKIAGIVDLSVTAKYGHSWTTEHRDGGSIGMIVKPGEVGWISRAQVMQQVSGRWQTHYDNQHWGHYYWYWDDTVTSPAPNGTDGIGNVVVVKTRPMTADEKASCGTHGQKVFSNRTKVESAPPKAPKPRHGAPTPGDPVNGVARDEEVNRSR
ncbi:hypothetical protein ACFWXK_11590 [Streptomyces sp. NPDC059070]|uniref:hypothetical protein n=1 Tax=Streptomyces sp. NPDC059070 TaxID=3346713 RepID=UPI0036AFA0E8